MYKIAVINVWMGPLPVWFPLWARSVRDNPGFEFILVTDQSIQEYLPDNLQVIRMSFDEVRRLIGRKLRVPIKINEPYKLCDFKPAYGEIFSDYLKGYHFWGCCDLDLLFGDLSKFITEDILLNYKKIFSRGHLTLYRNEPEVNAAHRSSQKFDHRDIYSAEKCLLYDEWHGIHQVFEELHLPQYNQEVMADIKVYSARLRCSNLPNYGQQLFVWENGVVNQYYLQNGRLNVKELAYMHFQKRRISLHDLEEYEDASVVLLGQSLLPFAGPITADWVRRLDRPDYVHYLHSQYKRLNKRFRSVLSK